MEHTLASRISSLMLRLAAVLGLAFAFALLGASFSASADDSPTDGLLAAVADTVDAVIPQPVSAEPMSAEPFSPESDATTGAVVAPLLDTAVMPVVAPLIDTAVVPVVAPLVDPVVTAVATTADTIVAPVVSSIATPVLGSVDRVVTGVVNRVIPAAILAVPFADVPGTATAIVAPDAAPGAAAVSRSALSIAPVNAAAPQLASAPTPLTSPVDGPLKSPLRPPLGSPSETPATVGAAGSVMSAADIQSTGLPARTIGGAEQLSPTEYPAPVPSFEHDSSPD